MIRAALIATLLAVGCSKPSAPPPPPAVNGEPMAMKVDPAAAAATVGQAPTFFDAPPAVGTKARCPVSGELFAVAADTVRAEHKGKHVVFCCAGCKPQFEANPERYLASAAPAAGGAAAAAEPPRAFDAKPAVGTKARCAVTGEVFTVSAETLSAEYGGKHYVFCCAGCKPRFEADPAKFAAPQ